MGFPFFLGSLAHIGLAPTSAQGYVGSEQCWLWMWDIYDKDVCVALPRPDPLWEISSFDTFTLKLLGLPFPISGNSLVVSAAARSYILEFLDPAFLYSSRKLPPQEEFALTVYKQHLFAARRCTIIIREAVMREKCSFFNIVQKAFEHYVVNFSDGTLTKCVNTCRNNYLQNNT